jgi:diguanylate cyclase (GGDEF)-like protein/PAS domain S-box-containing protein
MANTTAPIRILHLEDHPRDAELIQDKLEVADLACDIVLVDSREQYDAALAGTPFDLILCDYNVPEYDGLSALKLARQRQPDTPVIIISGSMEEEEAVKCLHLGATDYLLKQRLERFIPAVHRALQETDELHRRRQAETELNRSKDLLQVAGRMARMGGWEVELSSGRAIFSDEVASIIAMPPGTPLTAEDVINHYLPEYKEKVRAAFHACIYSGTPFDDEFQILTFDGRRIWIRCIGQAVRDARGTITGVHGAFQDITEKKRVEEALSQSNQRLTRTLESITDAFFTLNREWRFTYVNKEAERLLHRTRADLLNNVIWDEFKESVNTTFYHEYHRAVRDNCTVAFEEFYAPLDCWVEVHGYPSEEGLTVYLRDIGERKRAEAKVYASEERLRLILGNALDAHVATDAGGRIIEWNRQAELIFGWPAGLAIGWQLDETIIPSRCRDRHRHDIARAAMRKGKIGTISGRRQEILAMRRSGEEFPIELAIVPIEQEGQLIFSASIRDITERRQAALESARINRALQILSRCNEAMTRAENERDLRLHICRLIIDIGGYCAAWIGYAQDDEARSIVPVAYAGGPDDIAYITGLKLSWSEDDPAGKGPGGRTIRSGSTVIIEDLERDHTVSLWRASAQQCGYHAAVCLPLRDKDRTFGLLALYSDEVQSVADEEVTLLQEMADNLAFGISNLRSGDERRQLELAAVKVAASISRSTGTDFFEQLARNMAEAVGAQAGFVARLLPGDPRTARTVAAVVDGAVIDNFDYEIDGTPCDTLLQQDRCVVPAAVGERFPRAPVLSSFGAGAYVGSRLDNSAGQLVGVLFVVFREPLKRSDLITSTLQIFAARAASELERQDADARIHEQASLLDQAKDAIIVRGIDQRVHFWNKGAERLFGWTAEEAIGRSIEDLLYRNFEDLHAATSCVLEQGEWSGEIMERRKDGTTVWVEANWTLVRGKDGKPQSIFAITTDITQRKVAEREIHHLAFHDSLTLLPNRQLLLNRLQHALVISARSHRSGALMLIDLDNFKTLNDTLGHDKGDLLLQLIAVRLKSCVCGSDTVARLGGDEFLVLLENLSENIHEAAAEAGKVSDQIFAAFKQPYQLGGYEHITSPSIGVTLFNRWPDTVDEIMKRADLAMYQAKAAGRNAMRFFDPEMQTAVFNRATLEADLRLGLQQNEFILHYQPQFDIQGCVTGAEALVRWQNPKRGLVSPADFIPLAEDTGLILPLGRWVLETACAQLVVWATRPETAELTMAVNVSARQFHHPDFVQLALEVLETTGANPRKLKLELTESLLVGDVEDIIAKMTALKAKGVSFSLDDFGTGYSSLFYLKRLPLDQLKIDQSFIRDVLSDPDDAVIARTIVTLGQSLGLVVIAEGVETEAQRDFLAANGCHHYQGYLFSRPLPAEKFQAFMQHTNHVLAPAADISRN